MNNVQTMLIRQGGNSVGESIVNMKTIPATMDAVREYVREQARIADYPLNDDELKSLTVEIMHNTSPMEEAGWSGVKYAIKMVIGKDKHYSTFG